MRTEILIPWRDTGDPYRKENLAAVLAHYAQMGSAAFPTTFHLGDTDHARFNRSGARNAAAVAAGDWDVAVVVDADCLVNLEVLEAAVERAHATRKVILPHTEFMETTPAGRDGVLQKLEHEWDQAWTTMPWTKRMRPSGVIVFPRIAWDLVGGYDDRFTGWGFEDKAMLFALDDLAWGWERLEGRIWHLWHPSEAGVWNAEDKALFERYKQAHGNPVAMYALLLERRNAGVTLPA